jgi:hypothetical protein
MSVFSKKRKSRDEDEDEVLSVLDEAAVRRKALKHLAEMTHKIKSLALQGYVQYIETPNIAIRNIGSIAGIQKQRIKSEASISRDLVRPDFQLDFDTIERLIENTPKLQQDIIKASNDYQISMGRNDNNLASDDQNIFDPYNADHVAKFRNMYSGYMENFIVELLCDSDGVDYTLTGHRKNDIVGKIRTCRFAPNPTASGRKSRAIRGKKSGKRSSRRNRGKTQKRK